MNRIKTFFLDHFEGTLIVIIIIGILATGFLVYYKFSFLNFFFLPVILSGYFLGKKRAVLIAIFCVLLVILFQIIFPLFFAQIGKDFLDVVINIVMWSSFLMLAGYIIGTLSEQRESKLKTLGQAYVGVLEIILKYLEVADKESPRSVRVALLAGKIAQNVGLETSEVENIKSAALLYEAGNLQAGLSLFHEAADFVASRKEVGKIDIEDREKIVLRSTASLLRAVEPILVGYFRHYVEEADILDKNLAEIPLGSSIIALVDRYDRLRTQISLQEEEGISRWEDIEKLSGRAFPTLAVNALKSVISSS